MKRLWSVNGATRGITGDPNVIAINTFLWLGRAESSAEAVGMCMEWLMQTMPGEPVLKITAADCTDAVRAHLTVLDL